MTAAAAPVRRMRSTLLVLGALTAFGPMCTDMYLPAFPAISRQLQVPESVVQLTVTLCLLGLAFGQLVAGPVSDRLGRKPPILAGLAAFAAASLLCALAPNAGILLAARLVQGVAGAAGLVVARAVVRDMFSGRDAARCFATLMLVMGAAPILAPLAGAAILAATSWRGIFVALACFGAILIPAVLAWLPETLTAERRHSARAGTAARSIATLRDRNFLGLALTSGFVTGAMFAYIGAATFVLQRGYGLSPQQFALVFGGNAAGLITASQVSARLVARVRPRSLLWAGVVQAALGGVLLLIATAGHLPLGVVLVALFVIVCTVGLVSPNATALALEDHAESAGGASAALGVSQLLIGALLTPVVGLLGGQAVALAAVMAGSTLAALLTIWLVVPGSRARPAPARQAAEQSSAGLGGVR